MNMDEKVYVWRIKHTIAKNWGGRLSTPIKEMLSKLLDTIYIVIWSLNIHCHLVPEHSFCNNLTFATLSLVKKKNVTKLFVYFERKCHQNI